MRTISTRLGVGVAAACLVALGTAVPAAAAAPVRTPAADRAMSCPAAVNPVAATAGRTAAAGPAFAPGGLFGMAASRHATWLTTVSCRRTGIRHVARLGQAGANAMTNGLVSTNWSGYQVSRPANYSQAGWTVPAVRRPVPGYSSIGYYSSTWAGIGGGFNAGNGALIQAGTTQDVSSTGATTYYAWYEIVGGTGDTGSEVRITNLPIHPGDAVGGVGLWTATGAQAGVCNFTLNTCVSFTLPSSAPGRTAEWIVEAPSSGGILPLANFGSVPFVNACWAPTFVTGGPCSSIAAGGAQPISLQANVLGGWQTLAIPRALTANGGGFIDDYYQPVRQDPCPTC